MKPRITISLTADGQLEIWLNPEGRDALVEELRKLDEHHEHFHLSPLEFSELTLSTIPYQPTDDVVEYGKVLFRTDEWDKQFFPQVIS